MAIYNPSTESYLNNNCHGDDGIIQHSLSPLLTLDVVLDGVSRANGKQAIKIFKEQFEISSHRNPEALYSLNPRMSIAAPPYDDSLVGVIKRSHDLMLKERTSTTILAAIRNGDKLRTIFAGDGVCYLRREDDDVQLNCEHRINPQMVREGRAKQESIGHLYNCLGGVNNLVLDGQVYQIKPGDRLLLATDGISDNLTGDDFLQVLNNVDPRSAITALKEILDIKWSQNALLFKADDVACVVRYL